MEKLDHQTPLILTFFAVSGPSLVPDEITAVLGIAPTSSRSDTKLVGKPPDGPPLYRYPEWVIETERKPSVSTDEELQSLIAVLWPHREKIVTVLRDNDFRGAFGTTIRHFGYLPLISVTPVTLERLLYFGVEYSVDIFDDSPT